jgi:adenylate cyclase
VLIRSDPAWAAQAAELGLVDRAWLEQPADAPFRTAPPTEVVQRFLQRSAERKPSVLSALGLSALQALSLVRADPLDDPASREATVVFTDLEGFTRFTADFGDDAAAHLVQEHQRMLGPVVRSRGGRIVKRLGDGLMLTFPAPEAAVLASLELVESVTDPLRLRVGMHLGETLVTHDDVYGNVVNTAARITEHARGGQVLASARVRDSVAPLPGVRFSRARRTNLKGVDPILLCSIEWDR